MNSHLKLSLSIFSCMARYIRVPALGSFNWKPNQQCKPCLFIWFQLMDPSAQTPNKSSRPATRVKGFCVLRLKLL